MRMVINQIIDHPQSWDQNHWHCATSHCFGGWCQLLGTKRVRDFKGSTLDAARQVIEHDVRKLLDLTDEVLEWLVSCERAFAELYMFSAMYVGGKKPKTEEECPELKAVSYWGGPEMSPRMFPKLPMVSA